MTGKIAAETIITGHNNADFDALAAMVGAGRLYPEAVLIFPGSQEKNIRSFFLQSATYLFNFKAFKDIDQESVKRLVLVDTRQRSRVAHVAPILGKPGLVIEAFDHHPDSEDDLPIGHSVVLPWGSTTAIIVKYLRDRGLEIGVEEATILGLGIYEDTGSLTFNSTTQYDLEAAAWLRGRGMDLNVIADLLTRDLSAEQVTLLSELLESAQTHKINGIDVVITQASTEHYVGDFALLVHKMMDMQNIRVLFALGRMKDRVHLVARSRSADVDVGRICTSLGGGGHPYAASASIKDKTLTQAREELFALLYSQINPQILVRQIATRPPLTISEDKPISEAVEIMNRYGLKAMPVTRTGSMALAGLIENGLAAKALGHGLGKMPVNEYMHREPASVEPDTDLYPVMEIVLGQGQRLVPVMENGEVTAVVTRTDLINTLIQEPARIPESLLPERKQERNIASLLRERLPAHLLAILRQAGELAQAMGYCVYAVGGFVRDILLHKDNFDLDLVVEGDGIAFANALAGKLGGRVKSHHKFKTAVVILQNGRKIDVATARLEYYEYPAALPTVELSSIKMDLYRRDFTINALAVHLNPGEFGRLADFFGSQRDIKERIIRVLHSLSFVEDPTRILRAIRFEQRFGFRIGPAAERLIKNALELGFFRKLSGARLFHEILLILEEASPLACLRRMSQFGLLTAIHPLLDLDQPKMALLEEVETVLNWQRLLYLTPPVEEWRVWLLALVAGFDDEQAALVGKRLHFTKRAEKEFTVLRQGIRGTVGKITTWEYRKGRLSELSAILENLPLEGVLYLMARNTNENIRKHISLYLTKLRGIKVEIDGQDLKNLGVEPGPAYSMILTQIKAARIDGAADCRADQLALAEKIARGGFDAPPKK
jgi:tRNA nucleotidyltransferase (CCA-adding enzyme)